MNSKKVNILLILITIFALILRVAWLEFSPPSLHADEVSTAYNAYSILKTAKDEHGNFLPITLRAFGEWKSALDAYLMLPFIYLFGLNDLAVRLPVSILGTISVFLCYIFVLEISPELKRKRQLALLVSFFLAISPWHLHLSRYSIHLIPSFLLLLLGIIFFLKGLRNNRILVFSFIVFALSLYAYFSMKVIVPLLCLFLFIKYISRIKEKKWLIFSLVSALIFTLPLILVFYYEPKTLLGRPKSISVFYDSGTRLRIWKLQTEDGVSGINATISHYFHNKPFLYSKEIIQRYLSHLNPLYLLIEGDYAAPFTIPNMGILYLIDGFFIIIGISYFFGKKKHRILIFVIFILSILPAAFTYLTPSQNRTFNAVMIYMLLAGYGVIKMISHYYKFSLLKIFIIIIYSISFHFYLRNYYIVLPKEYAQEWGYGYKELNIYLNARLNKFQTITFLPETGMSYIYMLFLNKYPPDLFMQEVVRDFTPDDVGFEHVERFGKYRFLNSRKSWDEIKSLMKNGEIYIGRESEISKNDIKYEIYYPNGKVAFRIVYL